MAFPEAKEMYAIVTDGGGIMAIQLGFMWYPCVAMRRDLIERMWEGAVEQAKKDGIALQMIRFGTGEVMERKWPGG